MIDRSDVIETAHELDPLPASVTRLSELVFADEPDMVEISQAVSFDPILAGRVIRLANFVTGGARVEIVDLRQAVMRAGISVIYTLAVGASARGTVDNSVQELGLAEGELWRHSCGASLAAESLRKFSKVRVPAASTAALLHDIGKIALARHVPGDWVRLVESARQENVHHAIAETQHLGINHAELGGLIADHWQLPEEIRLGIGFHHDPESNDHPVCHAVHVANAASHHALDPEGESHPVHPLALERLGMDTAAFEGLCSTVAVGIGDMLERYGQGAAAA